MPMNEGEFWYMETVSVGGADALPWTHLRLPPFPQVALRVLKLVQQENIGLPQLCELISADTAFASEVLTVANSALSSWVSRDPRA